MSEINRVAEFEKVSYEQFKKDMSNLYPYMDEDLIIHYYNSIQLPKRSTSESAGYDFFLPFDICIGHNESLIIPTGIRCKMNSGWVLQCYPRSGHGFKYGIRLSNTVGIIDADYYNADNEGHIQIKLINDSSIMKQFKLCNNSAFCQGIFIPFGITIDDDACGERKGGFGSTDNK